MKLSLIIGGVLVTVSVFINATSQNSYDIHKALEYENVRPVVVIGAGPAGLAAALHSVRGGMPTVIIGGGKAGGQLVRSHLVENVLGFGRAKGKDIMKSKVDHVASTDVQVVPEVVTAIDFKHWPFAVKTDAGTEIHALSVIIATGSTPRLLGIPGESEYFGHGVSTCADCDAHFFVGEDVIVVGGGDSAIIYALILAAFAKTVTIVHRSGSLRAAPSVKQHLGEYENVKLMMHTKVMEIAGDGELVTHVHIENTQTGEKSQLNVTGVFLAIGHTPNSALFKDSLEVDNHDYIMVKGRGQHTSIPGVFAAGEVTLDTYRQVHTAEGDGTKAGMDAVSFLHELGLNEKIKHALKLYHYRPAVEDHTENGQESTLVRQHE